MVSKKSLYAASTCGFHDALRIVEYALYLVAIAVIVIGSYHAATVLYTPTSMNNKSSVFQKGYFLGLKRARIVIGEALNMSLTFILAADIIRTVRNPNYWQLGKLIILVLLREFIVYFLNREIQDLRANYTHRNEAQFGKLAAPPV
jgi:uncharacterized membrane protein